MAKLVETPFGPRDAVAAWLRANGVDPSDVPIEGPITITRDRIHYDAMLCNGTGHRYVAPGTDDVATAPRWAVLKVAPPANVQVTALA
ncbi:hypothetical protein GFH48_19065 [Streptomyces fagopyri]|uniref:Uncharacterized protein n=1 Tax=Streptomyces fagopyri TaxID=2662397 RepID=A0A5Q0LF04_9ACTN|nr:hypothetical protein [Streptomyces fagopyri]QFZ75089.1 hypothetical protein GFH48_19065 [Streptomyces fagopyri]